MKQHKNGIRRYFSFKRIIIPVLIGLGIALYMSFKDIHKPIFVFVEEGKGEFIWVDLNEDDNISENELFLPKENEEPNIIVQTQKQIWQCIRKNWHSMTTFCLMSALLMVVVRDFAYIYRIRILTGKQLSWKKSFQVIMLWEFSSALTPSVVGGSAVGLVILSQEGISPGRSTAIVMTTTLLDELFYILAVPFALPFAGIHTVFSDISLVSFNHSISWQVLFIIGYCLILILISIIFFAVFFKPYGFKRLFTSVCSLKFLKRWRRGAIKMSNDIIITSKEMKNKKAGFWAKTFGSTVFSWTARFFVVNFLLMAFTSGGIDHFLVFAKQLVMWVILLISPTPGGSGIAEFMFPVFFKDFISPGTSPIIVILWRLFTYYPYLIAGSIVLPFWLKRVLKRENNR